MEKTQDRRIRKTKQALKEGLLQLMTEKRLKDISVSELTEKVDLNRGTFYLHYKDIFDLLEQIEEEFFEEFSAIMNSYPTGSLQGSPLPLLEDIFAFLGKNSNLCTVIFSSNGNPRFINRLKSMIREQCFDHWNILFNKDKTPIFEYYYSYMLGGCISLVESWMKNGLEETPHEMAVLIEDFIRKGVAVLQ
ncbi:MAG: TetR/AcrR family transcriptional regulator [Lachnospiraceae bacterium]